MSTKGSGPGGRSGGGGGGGGSQRPPPPARAPVPPPAPARRPQLRPIGGIKPPQLRPLNVKAPAPAPKAAAAPPPAPPQPQPITRDEFSEAFNDDFFSSLDDDATSVMDRPVAAPPDPAPRAGGNQRIAAPVPAAGRPAIETQVTRPVAFPPPGVPTGLGGKPARPAIDLVPTSQRSKSERTQVMPEAPRRPPNERPAPTASAGMQMPPSRTADFGRSPAPISRPPPKRSRPAPGLPSQIAKSDPHPHREQQRERDHERRQREPPPPSVPELEALVPQVTNRKKTTSSRSDAPKPFDPNANALGPTTARVRPPSVFPPVQGHHHSPQPGAIAASSEHTQAMERVPVLQQQQQPQHYAQQQPQYPYTPSAPPVQYTPAPPPTFPPPAMQAPQQPQHFFGAQPQQQQHRSVVPGPLGLPLTMPVLPVTSIRPGEIDFSQQPLQAPQAGGAVGVFGLVLFAAPLAFATAVIAALALL